MGQAKVRLLKSMRDLTVKTNQLIETIYDTSLDHSLWGPVQRELCEVTGGIGSHILLFDNKRAPIETLIHSSADPAAAKMMEDDYFHWYHQFDDYRIAQAIENGKSLAVTNDELTPDSKKASCPLYNEYFRYYDVQEQLIFGTQLKNGSSLAIVHARPRDYGEYSELERELFVHLSNHVVRATEIAQRFNRTFSESSDLLEIVSYEDRGILVVDRSMNVLWMNSFAETELLSSPALKVVRSRLLMDDRESFEQFSNLVQSACLLSQSDKKRCGFMPLRIGDTSYAMTVLSSSVRASIFSDRTPVAVIVLQDPRLVSEPDIKILQGFFGFTPAEAKLARGISTGLSPKEYAEQSGLTLNTVRSTLKIVLMKAHCNKQAELVRIVSSLAGK